MDTEMGLAITCSTTHNIFIHTLKISMCTPFTALQTLRSTRNSFQYNLHFVSYGITNVYTSIPMEKLIDIIDSLCKEHMVNDQLRHEITEVSKIIIQQNYFQFLNSFFIQERGLAMGSPTSSIFSEIFLQHIENTAIFDILVHNNIIGYFRYVEDILIVYNDTITNIQDVF